MNLRAEWDVEHLPSEEQSVKYESVSTMAWGTSSIWGAVSEVWIWEQNGMWNIFLLRSSQWSMNLWAQWHEEHLPSEEQLVKYESESRMGCGTSSIWGAVSEVWICEHNGMRNIFHLRSSQWSMNLRADWHEEHLPSEEQLVKYESESRMAWGTSSIWGAVSEVWICEHNGMRNIFHLRSS